jgi:hypothetical protein
LSGFYLQIICNDVTTSGIDLCKPQFIINYIILEDSNGPYSKNGFGNNKSSDSAVFPVTSQTSRVFEKFVSFSMDSFFKSQQLREKEKKSELISKIRSAAMVAPTIDVEFSSRLFLVD